MRRTTIDRRTPLVTKSELRRTVALSRSSMSRSALHANQPKPQAKRRSTAGSSIPAKVRAALSVRSGGVCEVQAPGCVGRAIDPSHRKKTGAGGRRGQAATRHHVLSNLLHSCRFCHERHIHAYPAAAYWRGWALREGDNPASAPCLYRGAWSLLGDDGSVAATNRTTEESAR